MFRFMVKGCANPNKEVRDAIVAETAEKTKIVREVCGTKMCYWFAKNDFAYIKDVLADMA